MQRVALRAATLAVILALAAPAGAQAPPDQKPAAAADAPPPVIGDWVTRARLSLSLTQSSVTQNWHGDEVGTVSWLAVGDFAADNQIRPKLKLTNTLVLNFGQTHQQDTGRDNWLAPLKSADKIDYDGVARFTLGRWVDPFFAITFDSQFYQKIGSVSRNLNPFTVGESAGLARVFFDSKPRTLVSRLGFGFRQRNDRFAVAPAKETTNDGGFEWRTTGRFANEGDKTVYKTELTLFQALFFSQSDLDPANRWKTLDVKWENTLSNKINKWMAVGLYVEYVFDDQLSRAGQLKQTLGVGITADL